MLKYQDQNQHQLQGNAKCKPCNNKSIEMNLRDNQTKTNDNLDMVSKGSKKMS